MATQSEQLRQQADQAGKEAFLDNFWGTSLIHNGVPPVMGAIVTAVAITPLFFVFLVSAAYSVSKANAVRTDIDPSAKEETWGLGQAMRVMEEAYTGRHEPEVYRNLFTPKESGKAADAAQPAQGTQANIEVKRHSNHAKDVAANRESTQQPEQGASR